MKIAYLGIKGLPSQWGADRVVEAIATRLAVRHNITVYCNSHYTSPKAEIPNIRLVRISTVPGKYLQPVLYFVFSAFHALRQDYDLVHIHNAEACFTVPLLRLRHRVIATSHGAAYARDKWSPLGKWLIQCLDYFFVRFPHMLTSVSLPMAREYQKRYGRQVHYLPNGVDTQLLVDTEAADTTLRANGVDKEYILFAAGRLDPTKGCHLLLQAFNQIPINKQLVVVGNMATLPNYGRELQRMADKRTIFIPFIKSKAELFGIVSRAQVFVFPSTVEAMSMMLLETATVGTPIVCSDIPENSEVMGNRAVYFESGNVQDLADKLRWALAHPNEMQDLGLAAQKRVKEKYAWEFIAEQYEQLYKQLIYPEE